jgi:hypothetical protein
MCNDTAEPFDGARVRCVLPDRNVSSRVIIIGSEFRENSPQMLLVEHDRMIGALARLRAARPDQKLMLVGAIKGLEECRGKTPAEIAELITEAEAGAVQAAAGDPSITGSGVAASWRSNGSRMCCSEDSGSD